VILQASAYRCKHWTLGLYCDGNDEHHHEDNRSDECGDGLFAQLPVVEFPSVARHDDTQEGRVQEIDALVSVIESVTGEHTTVSNINQNCFR